jgi:hypothetical protein
MLDERGISAGALRKGDHFIAPERRHLFPLIGGLHVPSPSFTHCAV